MKGFLIGWSLMCFISPLAAAEQAKDSAPPTASPSHVLSILMVGDGDWLVTNLLGLSYEKAFNRWFSALGQIDYGQNENYGLTIQEGGVQLEARAYPFGRAPSGFFGNLRAKEFLTNITGTFSDGNGGSVNAGESIAESWWGLGIGYQWILFKVLALQASFTLDDIYCTDSPAPESGFHLHDKFGIGWVF
jgi:hypothetical protein